MISYESAIKLIKQKVNCLEVESLSLYEINNRTSAETITSNINIPGFRNSAMDGYALEINNNQPKKIFNITESIAAGQDASSIEISPYSTCKIMTGAMLPPNCNAVIAKEFVELSADKKEIHLLKNISIGENIRNIAADFSANDAIITRGEKIRSSHIASLAAIGVAKISVYKRPKIFLIPTGAELIDKDLSELPSGKIYDSNTPYLYSVLKQMGAEVHVCDNVNDHKNSFLYLLDYLITNEDPDLIVSTGAVSAGSYDFIPKSIVNFGGDVIFHKVKIRPGKPILYAKLTNKTQFFGLPGNPMAAAIGARFFINHWHRFAMSKNEEKSIKVKLADNITNKLELTFFKKAKYYIENGAAYCNILSGQESFKIKPLLSANCWAFMPENVTNYNTGDIIDIFAHNI